MKGIMRDNFDELMAALQAEHARLADMPKSPDVVRKVPTGRAFRQRWEAELSPQERRLWLRDSGVKVRAVRGGEWPLSQIPAGPLTPGDVPRVILEERGDLRIVIELAGWLTSWSARQQPEDGYVPIGQDPRSSGGLGYSLSVYLVFLNDQPDKMRGRAHRLLYLAAK